MPKAHVAHLPTVGQGYVKFDTRAEQVLGVPQNLKTLVTTTTIEVQWDPPTSDGGSPVTGYRVYRSSGGAITAAWETVVSATARSFKFLSLTAGSAYTVSVSAITSLAEAKASLATTTAAESTGGGGVTPGNPISVYLLPGKRPTGPGKNDGNPFATPIGNGAVLVDARLGFAGAATNDRLTNDNIHMGMDPGMPAQNIIAVNYTGSNKTVQSGAPNYTFPSGTKVRVPVGLNSSGKMNSCGAFISAANDGKVWQGQTTYCTDGGTINWAWTIPSPSTGPISLFGTSALGSHGGSRLSAAMGTIRAWEWDDDTFPIMHALVINLYCAKYLEGLDQGLTKEQMHRWPAVVSDGYAAKATSDNRYGHLGTPPSGMRMGVLLTLPTVYDFSYLTNTKARRIADAVWGYGGYVGDDTAWDVHAISIESTRASTWNAMGADFHSQLQRMFQDMVFVSNNSPTAIGGGGTAFRVSPPPPIKELVAA